MNGDKGRELTLQGNTAIPACTADTIAVEVEAVAAQAELADQVEALRELTADWRSG